MKKSLMNQKSKYQGVIQAKALDAFETAMVWYEQLVSHIRVRWLVRQKLFIIIN